ncbi:MAG TPA: calcium-binding protein [Solirubrobacteraceae bacterium]|nr:calcium-binding protein [Solirubrobacteraceae bacterium]
MTRRLLVVLATMAGMLVVAPAAQSFTTVPVWQCRGSAAFASVAGNNRVEPIVANGNINTANGASPDRAQCVDSETGAGNTPTQLGISPEFLGAVTGKASTAIDPDLGRAIDQTVAAEGRVEDLTLLLGAGGPTLGVGAANSTAFARCVAGTTAPQFAGDSRVADITLGGTPIPLDQLLTELTNVLNPLLGALVEIRVDERIQTADSLTINALHVIVVRGDTPLVDLVVGQAKVGANGPVCDPNQQNDGSGNGLGQVCASGSVLDVARNLCVIPAGTAGSSLGEIIIGRPFQGPSGGSVLPIDVARRRFGNSPCLSGGGAPRFAIVGTNRGDRITGTNIADRIIGLGGNDRLDGGRGNDCIEGRTGGDNISGALGNDRLYGSSGKDHLNGGPGTDYMSAGAGNDTINGAFGRDRALGGSGRDFINVATAGPAASVSCGTGNDVARINNNERRRVRGCERVAVFGNNDR